ncbi:hypothetical protein HK096_003412 [Nowakowskiella sp. JEL0078]|nr:hypothetical protein HK096_003412 [Nowakowskiella sp. JEL0078]
METMSIETIISYIILCFLFILILLLLTALVFLMSKIYISGRFAHRVVYGYSPHQANPVPAIDPGTPILTRPDVDLITSRTWENHEGAGDLDDVSENKLRCSICLERVREKDRVKILKGCMHVFHIGCIDEWLLTRSPLCPNCRRDVRSDIWTIHEGTLQNESQVNLQTGAQENQVVNQIHLQVASHQSEQPELLDSQVIDLQADLSLEV